MENRISWERIARSLLGSGLIGGAMAISSAATAQVAAAGIMLPASTAALVMAPCQFQASAPDRYSLTARRPAYSKASAIIGGSSQKSALERMIEAQSGGAVADVAYGETISAALVSPAMSVIEFNPCLGNFAPGLPEISSAEPVKPAATDFLASKRIKINNTSFQADWRRVNQGNLSKSWANQRVGSGDRSDQEILQAVNSYANHAIRYVEDRELWGKSDFWANAKTTFRLGKGDCEDIAIAKLQMLAAMGIRREDMVLTLTRDLVRQVDHAVLIVRLDGQYVMLDNTTDKLVDASASQGYRPILSFGKDQSWIHGY